MRDIWMHISSWQILYLATLSSGIVPGWGGWRSWRRCACSCASPACLPILCSEILARKASGRVVLMKHSQVCFHRGLHIHMPSNLDTPLLLSRTSAQCTLIRFGGFSIVACENTSVAISAIFKARRLSDSSSCTRPPSLAIVGDMFETIKKLVAAFGLTDDFQMCILGYVCCGYIGWIAVDSLVTVFVLGAQLWQI